MEDAPGADPAEGTVWTIAGGVDVLLTVWWVVLKRTPVTAAPVFSALITMQPEDYQGLDAAVIGEGQLAEAHEVAGTFLRDAGL